MKLSKALKIRDQYSFVFTESSQLTPAEADAVFDFYHTCGIFFENASSFRVKQFLNLKTKEKIRVISIDSTSKAAVAKYVDVNDNEQVNHVERVPNLDRVTEALVYQDVFYSITEEIGPKVFGFLADVGKTKLKALLAPTYYKELSTQGSLVELFGDSDGSTN